uniref:Transcription initiation factor TFIID subunit 12 n=1 Tax=Romanomermis culicivorax TaxID=13658 RepID=A0A915HNM5_ROMCU
MFFNMVATRFLTLTAHFVVTIAIFWNRKENVLSNLPLKYSARDYDDKDLQFYEAFNVFLSFIFAKIFMGFLATTLHTSACVTLAFYVWDVWPCDWYWIIFAFFALLPALNVLSTLKMGFLLQNQFKSGMLPNNNSPNNPPVGSPGSGYHSNYYNNAGFSPGAPSPQQQQQFGAGRETLYQQQQQQQQSYFYASNNGNSSNMQMSSANSSSVTQRAPSPNNRQFTATNFSPHGLVTSSGSNPQHQFTVPYATGSSMSQQQRPSSQGAVAPNLSFVRSAQLQQQSPMPVLQGHLQQQQPSPGQQNMMQMQQQQIRLQQQGAAGSGPTFQLQQHQGSASALQRLLGPGQQQSVHQGFVASRPQPALVQQHQFSPMTSSHQMQNSLPNHGISPATSVQPSHSMSTPSFHQSQNPGGSSETDVNNSTPLLTKQRLEDLAREIDPYEQLDDEVKDALLQYADDFIDSVAASACQLAKHRNSSVLEAKDVLLTLGNQQNL